MPTIKPLTSLRFFAAMMVLANHYWVFAAGYSGVTFFYVLSGYVLALNYAGKVSTPAERRLFWWKRFARIYPAHFLTFLLAIPLGGSLLHAVPNLLLLQSWVPSGQVYYAFNMPSWSISDEAAFYASFPFLFAALAGGTWRKLAIWTAVVIACAAAWSIAFPAWDFKEGAVSVGGLPPVALTHFLFYIFPPVRLVEFALGIGIAIAAPKVRLGTRAEVATCLFALASVASYYLSPPPALAASAIFFPAAVLVVFVFSQSNGLVARLLSTPVLVLLGEASFMLYMLHWLLMKYHFATGLITAAIAIGLSVALHLGFEKPVQRWLVSCSSRRSLAVKSTVADA